MLDSGLRVSRSLLATILHFCYNTNPVRIKHVKFYYSPNREPGLAFQDLGLRVQAQSLGLTASAHNILKAVIRAKWHSEIHTHIHVNIYAYAFTYTRTYIYIDMCVCIYIYIYIYVHIHTLGVCVYIYIYVVQAMLVGH